MFPEARFTPLAFNSLDEKTVVAQPCGVETSGKHAPPEYGVEL